MRFYGHSSKIYLGSHSRDALSVSPESDIKQYTVHVWLIYNFIYTSFSLFL